MVKAGQAGRRGHRRTHAASRAGRHPDRRRQFAVHRHPAAVRGAGGKGLRFIGMGVSGGEEGALEGPSMMPGGDREAYARSSRSSTKMAAQVDGAPCCAYIGPDGAGHLRQDGAQRHRIRRHAADRRGLRPVHIGLWPRAPEIADIFAELERGRTRLLPDRDHGRGACANATPRPAAARRRHPRRGRAEGHRPLDGASPRSISACRSPAITEAVFARALSGRREQRAAAEKLFPHAPTPAAERPRPTRSRRFGDALYAVEDRRLRAGLRADDGGVARVWLEARSRRDRVDLARRLHHPRPLPRPHPRGLRRRDADRREPAAA